MATTKKGNGLYAGEYKAAKGSDEMEALVRSLVRSQDGGLEGVSGVGSGRAKYRNRYRAAFSNRIMGTKSANKKVWRAQHSARVLSATGAFQSRGRPMQGFKNLLGGGGTPTVNKSAMDDALRAAIAQGPEAGSAGDYFDSFEAFQANTPEGYSSSYETVYKQKANRGGYVTTYEDTNEVDDNLTAIAKRAEYRRWQNNNSAYTAKVNASRGGVTGQVQSNYNPLED